MQLCACMPSCFSRVWLSVTLWTVAHQGYCRQEYWSGMPCPPPGDLPDPGIEPPSLLHWQAGSLPLAPPGKPFCSHGVGQIPRFTGWMSKLETQEALMVYFQFQSKSMRSRRSQCFRLKLMSQFQGSQAEESSYSGEGQPFCFYSGFQLIGWDSTKLSWLWFCFT